MHITDDELSRNLPNTATATLFVALYLVVLAFFIWLNSVAEKDKDRSSKALSSIHHTFSDQAGLARVEPVNPEILTFEMVVEEYFGTIRDMTRNAFPVEEVDISRRGNNLQVIIPTYRFFQPDSVKIRRKQANYLPKLVRILNRNLLETKVDVQFSLRSKYLHATNTPLYRQDIARVGHIARQFVASGLPEQLVTGGIVSGRKESIIIDFTVGFSKAHTEEQTEE